MKASSKVITILAVCLVSPLAQAHDNNLATGLLSGIAHPLTGLDHLTALILSGFLAGRRHIGIYRVSGALTVMLGLGAATGILFGAQTGVETLIILSLPIAFIAQWARQPGVLNLATGVMGLFLVAHGWAHGAEVHGATPAFISGLLLSSFLILALSASVSHHVVDHQRKFRPAQ